jgi:DNA polymerase (family 10)
MSNTEIVEKLEEAISYMELLELNVFKINAYRKLLQEIEKTSTPLNQMDEAAILAQFSKGMALVINQLLATETFSEMQEWEAIIPKGVRNMLDISGLGPKKVKTLWKDAGIETVAMLKQFCLSGQLTQIKGFAAKAQDSILAGIQFIESVQGKALMHKGYELSKVLENELSAFGIEGFIPVGDLVLKSEVVSAIEFLIPISERQKTKSWFAQSENFQFDLVNSGPFGLVGFHKEKGTIIRLFFAGSEEWAKQSYLLNSLDGHWQAAHAQGIPLYKTWKKGQFGTDEELFHQIGKPFVPADLRIGKFEWNEDFSTKSETLIQYADLKGCLHNHSLYSDGKNTIEEMANWCIAQGWQYFGIADHSKSAQYANGLFEEMVQKQWAEIDLLNQKLGSFKVLKGIESDILADGSLDYEADILQGFDYVVASVHSSMKMDISTATNRLIKAIENPYTTILGHCSGRILLKRPGYPLDYQKIIDACISNGVVIEINAHPSRLDMDWKNLSSAIEKGAMISINPDAHEKEGMRLMEYGTYMARKAGAAKENVLNTMSLENILTFLQKKTGKVLI